MRNKEKKIFFRPPILAWKMCFEDKHKKDVGHQPLHGVMFPKVFDANRILFTYRYLPDGNIFEIGYRIQSSTFIKERTDFYYVHAYEDYTLSIESDYSKGMYFLYANSGEQDHRIGCEPMQHKLKIAMTI